MGGRSALQDNSNIKTQIFVEQGRNAKQGDVSVASRKPVDEPLKDKAHPKEKKHGFFGFFNWRDKFKAMNEGVHKKLNKNYAKEATTKEKEGYRRPKAETQSKHTTYEDTTAHRAEKQSLSSKDLAPQRAL